VISPYKGPIIGFWVPRLNVVSPFPAANEKNHPLIPLEEAGKWCESVVGDMERRLNAIEKDARTLPYVRTLEEATTNRLLEVEFQRQREIEQFKKLVRGIGKVAQDNSNNEAIVLALDNILKEAGI
jgi:hypothetical protein